MKAAVGAAGATSLSGCAGLLEGSESKDVDPIDQEFQYAFQDKTGALGDIPDSNVDPEEASEFQVIENGVSEEEWDEMRRDDVEVARGFLSGELERLPQHQEVEGTVDDIVNRTQEIYTNPGSVESDRVRGLLQEDVEDSVRFARSLVHAVDTATGINTSGGKNMVVPNVAEYVAQEIGLDFGEFNMFTVRASEPQPSAIEGIVEGSIRERPDGSEAGIRGITHGVSLLTYSQDGELETKYVENTDASPQKYFFHAIRDPEDSAYTTSLDKETITMRNGDTQFPEHYVTGLELNKGLEMESNGVLDDGDTARAFVGAALDLIDDGHNNLSQFMANSNEGYDVTLTDSFVESADELADGMDEEDLRNYRQLGRAVYQIFENELGEDFRGDPIRGYDQPLKIDGTLEEPEFYHMPGNRPSE
ncbi:hypothetical protein ACK3SF_02490 [Candidatus Nanosalina sp. VS9-1]|uniref:hypothetical protein n=1 Tax=Candidatus Nanosalina sp. VS9-1 TaxID=3388566 RepID=UPI0039E0B888